MSTEFIGRERELANLRQHWEESAQGHPRLIICRGEAGIGKTRLATELTTWARTRGGRTLWTRALQARDTPPFWLWRQAFDDLPPVAEGDDRLQLFDTFAAQLNGDRDTAPGDSNDMPGDPGSRPGESSGPPDDSGGTLLVIDDIHWADEPSLLALLHIVRGWHEQRIMVCANARDEIADSSDGWRAVAPELLREPLTHVLDLSGLSPRGSAACLSAAAEREVPERIAAEAFEMSGGNPFYLRELGRGLRDRRGGSGGLEELRLPATLREVVRGRLATLPPRAQELLRAAAILDDEFSVAVAARLIGRPVLDCLSALDAAAASGLLVLESPGGTVRFTHALVRAALHEGLPLQQRVLLHARAARAIEDLYADTLDHHAAALARHYAESAVVGDRAPAVHWARRAGDNALRELAFEEAARLYGTALEHATGLPFDRGSLLVARATAHLRAGHLDPAHADCVAARAQAHRTGDTTLLAESALVLEPVGNLLWDRDIHQWCTEALGMPVSGPAAAGEPDGSAADRSSSAPLPESLLARLLARVTEAGVYLGYWAEVDETSSAAVELADRAGDDEALVAALRARQLACA
ncbi:AAA family ATPase, partial [Nocardia sp. JMUB6875]|uniref:ATP-binding protein n=1 Tax=Nocardia sp. JMUB6875 TaxID=3158170 RepID=UPI0034E88D48